MELPLKGQWRYSLVGRRTGEISASCWLGAEGYPGFPCSAVLHTSPDLLLAGVSYAFAKHYLPILREMRKSADVNGEWLTHKADTLHANTAGTDQASSCNFFFLVWVFSV